MEYIKTGLKAMLLSGFIAFSPLAAMAGNGVEISHLGVNNTLVRIIDDGKYLLLPVQEANEEARVNILVDGKLEKSLNVRLAKSKVDYTVPLNLEKYRGHDVVLNIVTTQGRSSVREAKEDACWNILAVADTFDTSNRERFRPLYHHTPLYGWMNDPNGMVYKDGVWHLCYQWNPYGSKWQNLSWGQSTSTDLIHWTHQPEAVLEPDGLGMIFSGSAAIDHTGSAGFGNGAVIAMYTSADASQIQSLASSPDGGYTYDVYPGNPVLTLESEARDPNMFWDEKAGHWVLTLAHALDHEMLIFTSPDMKEWTLQSSFGKGLGAQDGVWECPDLFELPVEGTDEKKWVLLCNINPGGPFGGSATQYFTGNFDGKTFTPDSDEDGSVPAKWMDYGKDHYATVSFSDAPGGRRTVMGWMSNWQYAADVPTLQFRSANTLPREAGLFRGDDGRTYMSSTPSPEVEALRDRLFKSSGRKSLGSKAVTIPLPEANDGICEIIAELQAGKQGKAVIELKNRAGDKVMMTYDAGEHTLSFDRRESGIIDFSNDFPAVTVSPTFESDGRISLRIFIDRSSIEVFGNDGRFAMTNLVFPNEPFGSISFSMEQGKGKLNSLRIYSLKAE